MFADKFRAGLEGWIWGDYIFSLNTLIPRCCETNYYYILRVQWLGDKENKEKPFYGYGHWSEASAHTHFIVVHNGKFFCNEDGWFDINELEDYLGDKEVEGGTQLGGVVTSAMRVIKGW